MTAWLEQSPQVEIICRDRGPGYGAAPTAAAPQARQVAERWHMFENASAVFLARFDPRCSACAVRPHPRGRSSRDPDPRRAYPVGWHSASPGTQPTDCGSCRARRADQGDGAHHRRVVPDVPQDPERPAPRYIPAASERARCLVAHARGRVERRMQGLFRTLAAPEGIRLYRLAAHGQRTDHAPPLSRRHGPAVRSKAKLHASNP